MPPVIIDDSHDKTPLTSSDIKKTSECVQVFKKIFSDLHPDNLEISFSVLEYTDEVFGCLVIEIIGDSPQYEAIGNINFKKIDHVSDWIEKGIQITSAYIHADYRGLGIAVKSYEILTNHYLVLSDKIQTHDGAAFWKFKMGSNAHMTIFLALWNGITSPEIILDDNSIPVTYNTTKTDLEPLIWGLESSFDKLHSAINASIKSKRENIVLVAIHIIDANKVINDKPYFGNRVDSFLK